MPKRKVTFQGIGNEDDEEEISVSKKKVVDLWLGQEVLGAISKVNALLDSNDEEKEEKGVQQI